MHQAHKHLNMKSTMMYAASYEIQTEIYFNLVQNPSPNLRKPLCRSSESLRVLLDVVGDGTVVCQELDVGTVRLDLTVLPLLHVLLAAEGSETPVLGDNDLLTTRELVLAPSQSLQGGGTVGVTGTDRQEDLTDVDTSDGPVGFTPSTTHTSLKPIRSGTGQHLVDTDDVEGVGTNPQVETILSGNLDKVFVGADTGSFESLRRQLLVLIGHQVDAQRELVDTGTLATKIEDLDFRVGDTTVEPRLGVWLVLAVAVATGGTAGHCW